jgi:hypothetical protein
MEPRAAEPEDSPRANVLRILSRLRQDDPDSFAGIIVDSDDSIELLVTASTPATVRAIDDARRSSRDTVRVRVVEVLKHSLADLERVRDAITMRHAELKARGVYVTEWGASARTNKVRIGVKDLTPASAELLARKFGAEMVDIVEGGEWAG